MDVSHATSPAQRPIELTLLRQLASYLDMPIFVVDAEGRLIYYNDPPSRCWGCGSRRLAPWRWLNGWPPSSRVTRQVGRRAGEPASGATEPSTIGRIEVVAEPIIHPGPTVGYRLSEGGRAIAYLPDHEPALGARHFPEGPAWTSGYRLAEGVDLLIHDAQYTAAERASRIGWGHSSLDEALAFAEFANVRALAPFHHDPAHADAALDSLFSSLTPHSVELIPAAEGLAVDVGRRRQPSSMPTDEDRSGAAPLPAGSLPAGRAA